jgi:hypothetical protein
LRFIRSPLWAVRVSTDPVSRLLFFVGCLSPGPRKNDLTNYWALGPFVRPFTSLVDPGDIYPPHPPTTYAPAKMGPRHWGLASPSAQGRAGAPPSPSCSAPTPSQAGRRRSPTRPPKKKLTWINLSRGHRQPPSRYSFLSLLSVLFFRSVTC